MKSNAELLDLLRRLYTCGVIVEVTDRGTLGLKGHPCPDDLKAELKQHRDDVVTLLQQQGIGQSGESGARLQYAVPCGIATCRILGPCGQFLTLRPCGLTAIATSDPLLESEAA